ncbi:hypothetical protein [Bradyrhizobium sp. AZCC 2289]|uniref:hypothetical protein n=1 Tax=Bradyrhizobium sp. AZCC 2289 TaxID=3117026 RepID=UPI002FF1EB0D
MNVRQRQIEDNEIRGVERCRFQSVSGVLGFQDGKAVNLKTRAKEPSYLGFVLDQENDIGWFIHRPKPSLGLGRAGQWKPWFPVPGLGLIC